MALTARSLVLDLLAAAPGGRLPVRSLVRAATLFDVTGNQVRVAISRSCASGHVRSVARGSYELGPAAQAVGKEIASWRAVETGVREWHGAWAAVVTSGLPRSHRSQVRRTDRALHLVGLRELRPGFWVRPDNLTHGVNGMRRRLRRLGLPDDAPAFELGSIGSADRREMDRLWASEELDRRYGEGRARLKESARRLRSLGPDAAARESFLVGGAAIRDIVRDPLLPEPLVRASLRRAFMDEMIRYDELGRGIWATFLGPEIEAPRHGPVQGGLEALHG